jgi:hypothetical protein
MCARYLTQKGSGWLFQIRVPKDLDSTLASIRLSIGSMPAIPARQRAVLLAGGALAVFQSVRKMNDSQLQARTGVSYRSAGSRRCCRCSPVWMR